MTQFEMALRHLVQWVERHLSGGNVNHDVFKNTCDRLMMQEFHRRNLRVPVGSLQRGILTLEVACALNGCPVPELLLKCNLPGVAEYNNLVDF